MGFTAGYKVNEGTDYEFTVSDETISEVVLDTGISESDIAAYCYSALIDSRIETVKAESFTDTYKPDWHTWCQDNAMFYYIDNTRYINSNTGINNTSDKVYERNFLVWYGTIYPGEPEEKTGWFLIMDIKDIKKFYVDFSNAGFSQSSVSSTITEDGITTPFTGYTGDVYLYQSNLENTYPDIYQNDDTLTNIRVVNVLNINDELWIGRLNPSNYGAQTVGETKYGYVSYTPDNFYDKGWLKTSDTEHFFQTGTDGWSGIPKIYDMEYPDLGFDVSPSIESYAESDDMLIKVNAEHYGSFNVTSVAVIGTKTINGILTWMSWCGLLFKYGGTTYKPIIENGVITGYSADMLAPSEFDTMTNVTGNNISPTPPGPVPPSSDDDNRDPISTTGAPFSAGLCHYYALTAGSVLLEHISEALGTWDIENTHKDLYKNLVSCKLIKPPAPIPTTGSAPFTIYGVKPQYGGADITLPVVSGNPEATFGPYTINRKFGDFRDYAPYTRVSIYLPYCGWCDLPSHVVGRQVTVKYFTDIIAATCKAVVFCNNNIIAEAAGVIGLDIPFVADNVGAKMQAVTAGMIAALGGGIQLGAGIGTMVSTKSGNGAKAALSGASQYLSGYSQMAMAFNENTTEISGKNGDGCCLAGATNIIIKIVRPKKGAYTTAPYTPPGYGHNVGFVSQKQVKVSSVSGLLIADNVDTSGISGATEAERAEIKRVLETGLIVNAAPE